MSASWRKVENENGFPFYVNESDSSKQWDHPKFSDIKQRLDDCNYIKYASYRVASKFRVLQHALHMNEVPLSIVSGVFEKHRLGATESSLCLESYDLEAILSDIYFAANKHSHSDTDVDIASELMMNFLYNVYDKDRKANIEVSSAKVTLALLSTAKLPDLYKFLFSLCADHNNCVTRLRLQSMLSKMSCVTVYLNENMCFGHYLVHASVEHCFNNSPGLVGVSESFFNLWLENVPQFFSWLPVLHRLKNSETVLYHGKCSVCKLSPLMGLRYRCLKCRGYMQCQRCFLTGRLSRSHKLSHTMREHCRESTGSWNINSLADRFFGLLKCAYAGNDGYMSDINIIDGKSLKRSNRELLLKPSLSEDMCNVQPLSSPLSQLQVIIKQLELQNKELQQMLVLGVRSDKEMKRCLEEHRIHVEAQIEKLKMLKDYIHIERTPRNVPPDIHLLESTPMVCHGKPMNRSLPELDLFSPIAQAPDTAITEKIRPPVFNLDRTTKEKDSFHESLTAPYSIQDLSTWIGGHPASSNTNYHNNFDDSVLLKPPNPPIQTDLDDALAKLQQILANNFSLDESLGNLDNCHLKHAVTEVEGMLSSIIDNVEIGKNSSGVPMNGPGYVTASS